jgi:hypothetical protein
MSADPAKPHELGNIINSPLYPGQWVKKIVFKSLTVPTSFDIERNEGLPINGALPSCTATVII